MQPLTPQQVFNLLVDWIGAHKRISQDVLITADTELLASGILDSFSYLDLIVYIEGKTGGKIDLAGADPDEFSKVRGLCNLALGAPRQRAAAFP
jgi:acyl carrier protein